MAATSGGAHRGVGLVLTVMMSVVLLIAPSHRSTVIAQESGALTVANWSFEIIGAAKAPEFRDTIHLGRQNDGREWLAVSFRATNTSDDEQDIHSDKVQLRVQGESIKQTGSESENAAKEIDFSTIGGSSSHEVDAGETISVLQIYKVDPNASEFVLEFDFNGKWELDVSSYVSASNGNASVLTGGVASDAGTSTPGSAWTIAGPDFDATLTSAVKASTFADHIHLGRLDDGRDWLVVTYLLTNTTSDEKEFQSDKVRLLAGGEEIAQAGDESRSAAEELGYTAPSANVDGGETKTFLQVFKVQPTATDFSLRVSMAGDWFWNLQPVIAATNGDPAALTAAGAPDLDSVVNGDRDVAQAVPTEAPTPTPEPTNTPEPTEPPKVGTGDNPAQLGETVVVDGRAITITDAYVTDSLGYGIDVPKGGYVYVVISVTIQNVSESGKDHDYNEFYFSAKDIERDWDFDDTALNFSDSPLGSGDLQPGEYASGQVVLEVHQETSLLRIKYDTSVIGGENAYWIVRL